MVKLGLLSEKRQVREMADINNTESIKENFEKITDLINSMRAQGVLSASGTDKILSTINTKLDTILNDENQELIKTFLAELKRNLEEKYGFLAARFNEMENIYNNLSKDKDGALKSDEIKEFFDIIATNLNVFSKEVVSQKDLLTEITLRIESMRADDSDKKEVLKNISALKVDLEHFNNGFESIVLNLNNNFKNITDGIEKIISLENAEQYTKDIENLYLTSNAILSAIQIIDQKSDTLNSDLNGLLKESDFKALITQLNAQNEELSYVMSSLAKRDEVLDLFQKIDTAISIITALKTVLVENGEKSHGEILVTLSKLEDTVRKILSEEEFDKFRAELSKLVSEVSQSTNLMRGDLLETNAELRNLTSLLNSIDIKSNFAGLTSLLNKNEERVTTALDEMSQRILQSAEFNTIRTVDKSDEIYNNLTGKLNEFDEKNNRVFEEVKNSVKEDLNALQASVQEITGSLQGKSQEIAASIIEQAGKFEQKISDVDFNISNFSKLNIESLEAQVSELKNSIKASNDEVSAEINQKLEKAISLTESLSASLVMAFGEADTSTKKIIEDNFNRTNEVLEKTSGNLDRLSDTTNSIGTALSFAEAAIKQKIEEEMGVTKDIVAKTSYDVTTSVNSFNDSFEGMKRNLDDLRQDIHVTTDSVREVVSTLPDTLTQNYEQINREGRDVIEQAQERVSSLLNQTEEELKNLSLKTAEVSENITNAQNFIDAKLSSEFDSVKDSENRTFEILDKSEKNLQTLIEDIHNITTVVSLVDTSLKQKFEEEIAAARDLLLNASENSSSSISNLSSEINDKLNIFEENAINSFRESDELTLKLRDTLSDNLDKVKLLIQETNEKTDISSNQVAELKLELGSVYGEIRLLSEKLNDDEDKQAVISNFEGVIQKLDLISENLGPRDRNKADFDYIERNLDTVLTILNEYDKKLENEELKDLIRAGFEKVEDLSNQVKEVENNVQITVTTRNNALSNELELTKNSIDNIVLTAIPECINNFKTEAELSLNDLKNHISENSRTLADTYQSLLFERFDSIIQRLSLIEDEQNEKRADGLSELKGLLGNMSSLLSDIISYVSVDYSKNVGNYSEEFDKIQHLISENSFTTIENFKYSIDDIVSKINEKLYDYQEQTKNQINSLKNCIEDNTSIIREEIKNYSLGISEIYDRFDSLDNDLNLSINGLKNNFLPLIESNKDLGNTIQSNLLLINEKMQEKTSRIEDLLSAGELKQIPELKTDLYDLFTELKQLNNITKEDLLHDFEQIQSKVGEFFANAENNKEIIISSINEQLINLQGATNLLNEKIVNIVDILSEKSDIRFNTIKENFIELDQKISNISDVLSENSDVQLNTIKENFVDIKQEISNIINVLNENSDVRLNTIKENFVDISQKISNITDVLNEKSDVRFSTLKENFVELKQEISNITNALNEKSDVRFNSLKDNFVELNQKLFELSQNLTGENKASFELLKNKIESLENKLTGLDSLIDDDMTKQLSLIQEEFMSFSNRLYAFSEQITNNDTERVKQISEVFGDIVKNIDSIKQKSELNVSLITNNTEELINNALNKISNQLSENNEYNLQSLREINDTTVGSITNAILEAFSRNAEVNISRIKSNTDETLNNKIDYAINVIKEGYRENYDQVSQLAQDFVTDIIQNLSDSFAQKAEFNKNIIISKVDEAVHSLIEKSFDIVSNSSRETLQNIDELIKNSMAEVKMDIDSIESAINNSEDRISNKIFDNLGHHSDVIVNEVLKTQDTLSNLTDKIGDTIKEGTSILLGEVSSNAEENNSLIIQKLESALKDEMIALIDNIAVRNDDNLYQIREMFKSALSENSEDLSSVIEQRSQQNIQIISDIVDNSTKNSEREIINKIGQQGNESLNFISDKINQLVEQNTSNLKNEFETINEKFDYLANNSNLVKQGNDNVTNKIGELNENISNLVCQNNDNIRNEIYGLNDRFSSLDENLNKNSEAINNKFDALSYEVNQLISQSANNLRNELGSLNEKANPDRLLSEISSYLNSKLDENAEDLKSFIDLKSSSDVDITVQIDNLKSDIVDMFNEYGKVFKDIMAQINKDVENYKDDFDGDDINEKLETLPDRIDNKIDSLISDYQNKLTDIICNYNGNSGQADNSKLEEIINSSSSRLMTSFESMKNELYDEIFSRFEEFNINIQRQIQIMQKLEELSEFSKNVTDNSDLALLNKIKEAIENTDRNIISTREGLEEKISELKNSNNTNEIVENLKSNINKVSSEINAKLEDLNVDIRVQNQRIQDLENVPTISEIEDLFNMNVHSLLNDFEKKLNTNDSGELKSLVEEIKSDINSQLLGLLGKISFVSEQEEIIDFVQDKSNELKSLMKKLDNSLDSRFEDGYKGYADELRELVKDFKENSNFKDTLNDIKKQLDTIKSSDEKSDYTYSLQDIETDIAKLRVTLNQMSETSNYNEELDEITKSINELASTVDFIKAELPHNEVFEIKNEIERISEDLVSISTRTNKLILTSNESNNELRDNLSDFRLVIRDLDERTRDLANTTNMEKMNARVEQIGRMVNSCINSDKILNQAFGYLAEWIDGAGENLNFISENMNKFENLEATVENLSENVKFITENNDNSQNFEELKSIIAKLKDTDENKDSMLDLLEQKFELQQNRIDELELKLDKVLGMLDNDDNDQLSKKINSIDKQLSKLNKSIERLTSYVDEE